nr:glycosyltransferase family 10 [Vibrio scophthalmi]
MPIKNRVIRHVEFSEKKLLTTVVGNKTSNFPDELYSKRIEAINFFQMYIGTDFDLYGMGWDKSDFPSYKGSVDDKLKAMSNYKFTLCYENQCNIDGLISEKIFDCFYARSVPIFWGANNVEKYIPEECFIDKRKFNNYFDLLSYLETMTEGEYNIRVEAVEKYLKSDLFQQHSSEMFAKTIYNTITSLDNNVEIELKKLPHMMFFLWMWGLDKTCGKIRFVFSKITNKLSKIWCAL